MSSLLALRLSKSLGKNVISGCPWAYAGEIIESSEQALAAPGELAELRTHKDEFVALGYFNAKSQIAFRVLTRKKEPVDTAFFIHRIESALKRREKHYKEPFYRLIHSEGDHLPGLVVDRFAETLSIQVSTAGMERLFPQVLEALDATIAPKNIILRNDIPVRTLEGLAQQVEVIRGEIATLTRVRENGCTYLADLAYGQKTGWFYDMRDNRELMADYAKGKNMLDIYSHSGGFGLLAAKQGARSVLLSDSSELALKLAQQAVALNDIEGICSFRQGDALEVMASLAREGKRFEVVVADPPPFIRSKAHVESGMRGYAKVAHAAAQLVAEDGHLFIASCSHHASESRFRQAVMQGISETGRYARVVKSTGVSADHPVHPKLPQGGYIKALVIKLS